MAPALRLITCESSYCDSQGADKPRKKRKPADPTFVVGGASLGGPKLVGNSRPKKAKERKVRGSKRNLVCARVRAVKRGVKATSTV